MPSNLSARVIFFFFFFLNAPGQLWETDEKSKCCSTQLSTCTRDLLTDFVMDHIDVNYVSDNFFFLFKSIPTLVFDDTLAYALRETMCRSQFLIQMSHIEAGALICLI